MVINNSVSGAQNGDISKFVAIDSNGNELSEYYLIYHPGSPQVIGIADGLVSARCIAKQWGDAIRNQKYQKQWDDVQYRMADGLAELLLMRGRVTPINAEKSRSVGFALVNSKITQIKLKKSAMPIPPPPVQNSSAQEVKKTIRRLKPR